MSTTQDQPAIRARQATPVTPAPTLVITSNGTLHGQRISLEGDALVVGRRQHSDVSLPDPCVSRSHAVVRKHGAATWIDDLASTGGTWVNEQRVTGPQALRHGDHVRFGAVLARFEDPAAAMERDDATEMAQPDGRPEPPVLSPRQHQILTYLRDGWTNPEIARQLEVTERTVKAHCQELFDRLGTHNRTGAVVTAIQWGLLDPAPTRP